MAFRRLRIKGIPNVLARKKPAENTSESNHEERNHESVESVHQREVKCEVDHSKGAAGDVQVKNEYHGVEGVITKADALEETSSEDTSHVEIEHKLQRGKTNFESVSNGGEEVVTLNIEGRNSECIPPDDVTVTIRPKEAVSDIVKPPPRRKFINPKISASAVRRNAIQTERKEQEERKSDNLSLENGDTHNLKTSEDTNVVTYEQKNEISQKSIEIIENVEVELIEKIGGFVMPNANCRKADVSVFTNESAPMRENHNLTERANVSVDRKTNVNVVGKEEPLRQLTIFNKMSEHQKSTKNNSPKINSDAEYTPFTINSSKIANRSRIKAIPRFANKRTNFSIGSASESEDESQRSTTRVRNDSVCSAVTDTQSSDLPLPTKNELYNVVRRKCKRSEHSHKLAEARREFQMKFNKETPDKQKLTMIDLIVYNPVTNPMSRKKKRNLSSTVIEEANVDDSERNEEDVDDPDAQKSDGEDGSAPAPQIKIDANGEIILDEKSLTIENTKTKRDREALLKSNLIDGDSEVKYGIYKKPKRVKDWSKAETLRFYKALNMIGTDFTIMGEFFPGRARQALKHKFKREERMNAALINRALMQPVDFDIEELRKDLANDLRKEEEMKQRNEEIKKQMFKKRTLQINRKKKKMHMKGIDNVEESAPELPKRKTPKRCNPKDIIKKGINGILDDNDDWDNSSVKQTENNINDDTLDERIVLETALKPARSSRISKTRVNIPESTKKRKFPQTLDKEDETCYQRGKVIMSSKVCDEGSVIIGSSPTRADDVQYNEFIMVNDNREPIMAISGTYVPILPKNSTEQNIVSIVKQLPEISVIRRTEILDVPLSITTTLNPNDFDSNVGAEASVLDRSLNNINKLLLPSKQYLNSQNITISHDDNKLTIVTEDNI